MKTKMNFLLPIAMTLALAGLAKTPPHEPGNVTTIRLEDFEKIIVNAEIDVALVQNDTLHMAWIEGDPQLAADISISVNKGVLQIDTKKPGKSYKDKLIVTLSVKGLNRLEINSASQVASLNTLDTSALWVTINGECRVGVKATGKIYVDAKSPYSFRMPRQTSGNY